MPRQMQTRFFDDRLNAGGHINIIFVAAGQFLAVPRFVTEIDRNDFIFPLFTSKLRKAVKALYSNPSEWGMRIS